MATILSLLGVAAHVNSSAQVIYFLICFSFPALTSFFTRNKQFHSFNFFFIIKLSSSFSLLMFIQQIFVNLFYLYFIVSFKLTKVHTFTKMVLIKSFAKHCIKFRIITRKTNKIKLLLWQVVAKFFIVDAKLVWFWLNNIQRIDRNLSCSIKFGYQKFFIFDEDHRLFTSIPFEKI